MPISDPNRPQLERALFECRFVAHARHPRNHVVYGKRVKDYAAGVAAAYWKASLEEGRSPEQYAADDVSFWPQDHGAE